MVYHSPADEGIRAIIIFIYIAAVMLSILWVRKSKERLKKGIRVYYFYLILTLIGPGIIDYIRAKMFEIPFFASPITVSYSFQVFYGLGYEIHQYTRMDAPMHSDFYMNLGAIHPAMPIILIALIVLPVTLMRYYKKHKSE